MKQPPITIIILIIIGLIFIISCQLSKTREGFSWDKDLQTFIYKKNLNNPKVIYNIDILRQYVSPQDTEEYLDKELWPWYQNTKTRYKKAFETNPYIRTTNYEGIKHAQRSYPNYAINYILDQQIEAKNKREQHEESKKQFMEKLYPKGIGIFGFTSGLF